MKKRKRFGILAFLVVVLSAQTLMAGDGFSIIDAEKSIYISGGVCFPTGNEDWWSSLQNRTNFEMNDFICNSFGAGVSVNNTTMTDAISIGFRYTNYIRSSEYSDQYKALVSYPDSIEIDIDIDQIILNADVSLEHKFFSIREFDLSAGIGGGLSWWKIGLIEHKHDNDFELSEYYYGSDTSITPHLFLLLKMHLFKQFAVSVNKTFLRRQEHLWDTNLSLDSISIILTMNIFKLN